MSKKVFVWDVGAVILHWDANEFLTKYQNGKFLPYYHDVFGDNWKRFDRGELSLEDMVDIFSEKFKITQEAMRDFMQAVFHSLKPNWPVIHLIQQLQQYGHHYCLTNGSEAYFKHVTSEKYKRAYGFSLQDLFQIDQVVLSAPLQIAKPELAIYQHTQNKFKLTNSQIIFIDDSAANIHGAKEANWEYPIHYRGDVDDLKQQIADILEIDLSLDDLVNSDFGQASHTARRLR